MPKLSRFLAFLSFLLLASAVGHNLAARGANPPTGQDVLLKAADITPKIFPEHVFFRGQAAPAQLRNTGGVHFADDFYVLAGLVDSSGYSTAIREKYQGYLLNEVTLEIGGQTLKPGAYIWPSSLMATRLMERLRRHRHPYGDEHLSYDGVGHAIPFDYIEFRRTH